MSHHLAFHSARHLSGSVLAAVALVVAFGTTGCADEVDDGGHGEFGAIELETPDDSELLARWTPDDGWTGPDGQGLDELPDPVDADDGRRPLTVGDERARLNIRYYDANQQPYEIETLEVDDETDAHECTEWNARYFAIDDDTDVIAWPNIAHPDAQSRRAPHQFAERDGGEIVPLYRCDHVHIYPEQAGTVDIEFVLWHIDHSDDVSAPITLRVEED